MISTLAKHWVWGAGLSGLLLLGLVPVLASLQALPALLIFLTLPFYMLHQVEEHAGDRFRSFVNDKIFGGVAALTPAAVVWINVFGVWGSHLIAIYLATFVAPGWALAAPCLMLVNALTHLIGAGLKQCLNPGFWTSLFLFLPLAGVSLPMIPATSLQWAIGFGLAIAFHGVIVLVITRHALGITRQA